MNSSQNKNAKLRTFHSSKTKEIWNSIKRTSSNPKKKKKRRRAYSRSGGDMLVQLSKDGGATAK